MRATINDDQQRIRKGYAMRRCTTRKLLTGLLCGAFLGGSAALYAASAPSGAETSAASLYRANLIANGGAETVVGSGESEVVAVPGWTVLQGQFTAVRYGGADGFPDTASPGPAARGGAFFAGGNGAAVSEAYQDIDVAPIALDIDAGRVSYTLRGYFGGFQAQQDKAFAYLNFRSSTADLSLSPNVGHVTAEDRAAQTGLLPRSVSGKVPPGTRTIQVYLFMSRASGGYNDGYADSLELILDAPTSIYLPVVGK